EDRPDRPMRVLAAVLAYAGWIALDIAGILLAVLVERGREQPGYLVVVVDQQTIHRVHRLRRVFAITVAGDHAPRLRDGVDLALLAQPRAEWRTIVVIAAAVPLAVPGFLQRFAQCLGV